MTSLDIKWGKEALKVDVPAGTDVPTFKQLVYSMTSVPVEKQKFLGFACISD